MFSLFSLGSAEILGAESIFQHSSSCQLLLLVAKTRHYSGQCPQEGRGLLCEKGALLLEQRKAVRTYCNVVMVNEAN